MTELETRVIEERYGFRVSAETAPLGGGYENDVFRISTAHGRFAVRVCAPWIGSERVAAEHDLLLFLSGRIPEVQPPVAAVDGTTWFERKGRVVCVFPLVRGQAVSRDDDDLRIRSAELLARIHSAGLDYRGEVALPSSTALDWEHNHFWDLGRVR
ncbi:MAG: phosphotransferase, partial [Actinobacteria bacterium]|nr:phosphotransferase [Actinomycetota bacterium]